jgi:hypothetical protein
VWGALALFILRFGVAYLTRQHFSSWSVLDDQQCARALMWTCITIIYLVPATALTIHLLATKKLSSEDLFDSELNAP